MPQTERFLANLGPYIRTVCRGVFPRMTSQDLDDAVQDTLCVALRNRAEWESLPNQAAKNWLAEVARRTCRGRIRKDSRRARNLGCPVNLAEVGNGDSLFEVDLDDLLNALPEQTRRAAELLLAGYTRQEAAEILNVCERTITKEWERTRDAIKKEYSPR